MPFESIRIRGLVQGVGFRPTVWRIAHDCGLRGGVLNDGDGVLILARVESVDERRGLDLLLSRLRTECPPLARIDAIEPGLVSDPRLLSRLASRDDFLILASAMTLARTGIVADAATCQAYLREIRAPSDRRNRYPFTNCTHCGPRLSIVAGIPYDRTRTSMAEFRMCPACSAEYEDPGDRRFHAQPNACPVCEPRVWLSLGRGPSPGSSLPAGSDPIATASRLLAAGQILAIKGIGGFHLARDATNAEAVAELRRRKRRFAKPLALMARDLEVIRDYCRLSEREAALLSTSAAPILLLERREVAPRLLAVDLHPDYRSSLIGRAWAARDGLPLVSVQHHHAHLAAVLAEHGWPLDGGPVLGILLDGLGYGSDGTVWGGELLLGDYREVERVAHLKPVAMPGGTAAILEPWRNLYAQLESAGGWSAWRARYAGLEPIERLAAKPLPILRRLIERGINAPLASSAGRLFDAVAAALGIGGAVLGYEGQAAIELESLATPSLATIGTGYPFARLTRAGIEILDPAPLWTSLFEDLARGRPSTAIAAAFHIGFARAIGDMARDLARRHGLSTLVLSGGVFQNKLLLETLIEGLESAGLRVLSPSRVPANDGGIALGQAAVASARMLDVI